VRSSTNRPSPAMVVAAIALAFALAGTAVAADPAAKLSKSKVKTIANKQIKKAAPNLSVAKAKTADDLPDLDFAALTLKNGWAPFNATTEGAPGIALGADGTVHLHGAIMRTAGTSFNPFTVPAEMRPSVNVFVPVNMGPGGFTGRLFIAPSGEVVIQDDPNTAAAAAFTSLSASYTLPY
jgi:hypothetical protein